jgi:hypothetical protein
MQGVRTRFLLAAATFLSGILAGTVVDRALVGGPGRGPNTAVVPISELDRSPTRLRPSGRHCCLSLPW